jgi:hypothetical protein
MKGLFFGRRSWFDSAHYDHSKPILKSRLKNPTNVIAVNVRYFVDRIHVLSGKERRIPVMRINTQDETLKRNYLQKYRFLIREYEQVKAKRHPRFRLVKDFYLFHDTDRRSFLKYYHRFKQSGKQEDLLPQGSYLVTGELDADSYTVIVRVDPNEGKLLSRDDFDGVVFMSKWHGVNRTVSVMVEQDDNILIREWDNDSVK